MGGQAGGAGGAKSRTPPNPNFGGGIGMDNSNGVANAAQATGTAPMTTNTNPATTTATATATPAPGAGGVVPASGKGTTKGSAPPAAAGPGQTPQQTAQSSYASTMGAALKGQPVPLPEGTTMGDMGGMTTGVWRDPATTDVRKADPDGTLQKQLDTMMAAEPPAPPGGWNANNGGVVIGETNSIPPNPIYGAPNGREGTMMRGGGTINLPGARQRPMPMPSTGAEQRQQKPGMMNYDQWLASRPAGQPLATNDYQAYTETFNQPQQGVGTPPPATGPATPQNPFGGTGLQQKLQAKGANPQAPLGPIVPQNTPNAPETQGAGTDWISKLTARGGTAETPVKGDSQDWQSVVKKLAGDPNADPVTLMQQAYAGGQTTQNGANMRRYLESNGIDPYIAANLENAFGSSGADSEMGAKRVGLFDRFQAGGANGLKDPALQAQNNLNWYLKNAPNSPAIPALRAQLEKARAVPKATGAVNTAAGAARRAEEAGLTTAAMDTAKTQNDAQAAKLKAWAESDNPDDPTGYFPGSAEDKKVRAARAARIAAKGTAPNDTATEHQRGT